MEEREAATIGRQTAPQIIPALDLVHGLVSDQLLQHRGRRLPVDPTQLEEAAVEPRAEQMPEVGVEQLQFRLGAQPDGDVAAHGDQRGGAAGRRIHSPQQLLPWRIGGLCKGSRGFSRGIVEIEFRRRPQRRPVGLKPGREITLEVVPALGVEGAHCLVQFARDKRARCLAALRQQGRSQLLRPIELRWGRVRPGI